VNSVRLLVVSCPGREPIQQLWHLCQRKHWPDCPFPVEMLSPSPDIGWNANLLRGLHRITESLVLLMLDDHFPPPNPDTSAIEKAVALMEADQSIGMLKLQAGNAHAPELPYDGWERVREYDRAPHPFKRTNLVPTLFRRIWLMRLCDGVLKTCSEAQDRGREGAINFEVHGTRLTEDGFVWPERILGIHRTNPDGTGGDSIIACTGNDGVREGRIQAGVLCEIAVDWRSINGIEAFL
jgi:hypothetical protein